LLFLLFQPVPAYVALVMWQHFTWTSAQSFQVGLNSLELGSLQVGFAIAAPPLSSPPPESKWRAALDLTLCSPQAAFAHFEVALDFAATQVPPSGF
jgi:hypothetical protein